MKLSIIIPTFNEEDTLRELLAMVIKAKLPKGLRKEIIVVDDGSTDSTSKIVRKFKKRGVILIRHQRNRGKGWSVRTGITKASGEIILIQDADLEYNPTDYHQLVHPIFTGQYDVVFGSRELNLRNKKHSYLSFYLGGLLVTKTTNFLFGTKLSDVPTGYKVFRAPVIKSLNLSCQKFEFCPEVAAKIAKRKIDIKEVPIRYSPRSLAQGKKIRWFDGVAAIWTLVRYRFSD